MYDKHALLEYDKKHFSLDGRQRDIDAKVAAGESPIAAEYAVDTAYYAARNAACSGQPARAFTTIIDPGCTHSWNPTNVPSGITVNKDFNG